MAKKRQPYYDWNEEGGIATCILDDGKNTFLGLATCHPDDEDFQSEKTGLYIAEARAEIQALKHYKNNVLKPGLDALKQLYYSMNHSKQYNKKSYEAKMLYKQMKIKENDIKTVQEIINERKSDLKKYIDDKDTFYKTVKRNRGESN